MSGSPEDVQGPSLRTDSVQKAGFGARLLLGTHLAIGPVLGILGTGAAFTGPFTGQELSPWLFLAVAIPGMALGMLPSSTTMVASGALFGWSGALFLLPGLLAASLPGFFLIRRSFRAEARELLARHPSAHGIARRLETRTFAVATLLRLAPVSTFSWTNAILSASALTPTSYLATTFLGILPRLALLTWAGLSAGNLATALHNGTTSPASAAGLTFSIASLLLLAWLAARFLRPRPEPVAKPEPAGLSPTRE